MVISNNINLLSVGIAIAGLVVLGFMVFFDNRRSLTNRTFFYLTLSAIVYCVLDYLCYQVTAPGLVLWLVRFTVFFAIWYAFFIYRLSYVFPREASGFSKQHRYILIPLVAITSLVNLSPLVFPSIAISSVGQAPQVAVGPGIYLFVAVALFLLGGAIFDLAKKMRAAAGIERSQFTFVFLGLIITFTLHIIFNLILPAVFLDVRFIPLAATFTFPLIALTTYAIFKHHLLNIKVISTEIFAFALSVVTFSEVILSQGFAETLFRAGEFVLILVFSVFLIKSVLREVEQREELQRLNRQIEDANKKLEELSHFKSELLSLASHQIRSPLAAMKGFLSLIIGGSYGPVDDKAKEALHKVEHSANELIDLINTLLDVRKVEEGKMEYQFVRTDLNKMVGDVTELLRPLAETKKLEFTFDSPGREVWVNADTEKFKQVVQNLVDNAIKYTPAGFVHVSLEDQGGVATMTVADSGLGFSATLLPYLFEEFIRDERVKKEIRGTGLGLYIARKIAEAHGGKIWAASAGEGKGSAFHVSIPTLKEVK